MAKIKTPTWKDVLLPNSFSDYLRQIEDSSLLNYMVNDRVYHVANKINYSYVCARCLHRKVVFRQYEDCYDCENCGRYVLSGMPFWKENKQSVEISEPKDVSRLVRQMQRNCMSYFNMRLDRVLDIGWDGIFSAKFFGGDKVNSVSPTQCIMKAAICCPFLWDSNYDWDSCKFDRFSSNLHLLHLMNQWVI